MKEAWILDMRLDTKYMTRKSIIRQRLPQVLMSKMTDVTSMVITRYETRMDQQVL
jgi:hypothetical protein